MEKELNMRIAQEFMGWKWIHNETNPRHAVIPGKICVPPEYSGSPVSAPTEQYSWCFLGLPNYFADSSQIQNIVNQFLSSGYRLTITIGYIQNLFDQDSLGNIIYLFEEKDYGNVTLMEASTGPLCKTLAELIIKYLDMKKLG